MTVKKPKASAKPGTKVTDQAEIERTAKMATSSIVRAAAAGMEFTKYVGEVDINAYYGELAERSRAVQKGDLSLLEAMLSAQANTLDAIFNQHARRAASAEYTQQLQAHMTIALKAQAQCRTTVEALAEIKNPRPVAFVKQANIANGPQQVNNGTAPPNVSRAHEESGDQSNKLLERQNGEWLDTGTAGETGRGNQALEAMGTVNGAKER